MTYRIKSVSALTGLTASTLRAWERRYGLLSPERTSGGYRLYTEDDVARLVRIKSLLDHGFKVSEAITLVEREVAPLPPANASPESLVSLRGELLSAFLMIDRPAASRVAARLASLPFERRIEEVLLPTLREMGERWACQEANVAQEHFASYFIREKLGGMLEELHAGPERGPEALLAGVPGESHDIGLLASAVHLALRGWRVTYLGADLPFADLQAALDARPVALVCSAIVLRRSAEESREILRALRAAVPRHAPIVVGSAGVPASLETSGEEGVYLVRDIPSLLGSPVVDTKRH